MKKDIFGNVSSEKKTIMQKRHHIPRFLLLASGISGLLFFATIDFVRPGATPHFGMDQLTGIVISALIVLTSMHSTRWPHAKTWFGTLLLVYFAGMLFMGLRPTNNYHHIHKELLLASRPPIGDFIINILGFIPFSYLFMAYRFSSNRMGRIAMSALLAFAAGVGISLFLEMVQCYIPGRTSSLMDLIANTAGSCIGVAYFMLEQKFTN